MRISSKRLRIAIDNANFWTRHTIRKVDADDNGYCLEIDGYIYGKLKDGKLLGLSNKEMYSLLDQFTGEEVANILSHKIDA